jgi:hypothetical protein
VLGLFEGEADGKPLGDAIGEPVFGATDTGCAEVGGPWFTGIAVSGEVGELVVVSGLVEG